MKIILLEKIKNLGNKGDLVTVKSGYARNFLIPKNKSTMYNKNHFNINRNKLNNKNIYIDNDEEVLYKKILELNSIIFYKKSNNNGKLFDSVNSKTILFYIKKKLNIDKKNIIKIILNKNIRNIGTHLIKLIIKKKIINITLIIKNNNKD